MKQSKNKGLQASPERDYIFLFVSQKIVHFDSTQTESMLLPIPNCNSALTIQHKIQALTGNVERKLRTKEKVDNEIFSSCFLFCGCFFNHR